MSAVESSPPAPPRQAFLTALFQALDRASIGYCVLRNYENIYQDDSSDVDMAVEAGQVQSFKESLDEAAAGTGYRFVLGARYVNYSYVYWHSAGGFIRIDLDCEVRWRIFPVLSVKAIIGLRRKHGTFYIPHPRHESVVLFVAAIWRGNLSERYRRQLGRLFEQLASPEELRRTFVSVFGTTGERLAEFQAHCASDFSSSQSTMNLRAGSSSALSRGGAKHCSSNTAVPEGRSRRGSEALASLSDRSDRTVAASGPTGDQTTEVSALLRLARRSLMRNALRDAPNRRALMQHAVSDLGRLRERLMRPPGVSLLFLSSARTVHRREDDVNCSSSLFFISTAPTALKLDDFFQAIRFLFPSEKAVIESCQLAGGEAPPRMRLRLRLQWLKALFKGGMFLRFYCVTQDSELTRVVRRAAHYLCPSRSFVCVENSRGEIYLVHARTGFMAEVSPGEAGAGANERMLQFISGLLKRTEAGKAPGLSTAKRRLIN